MARLLNAARAILARLVFSNEKAWYSGIYILPVKQNYVLTRPRNKTRSSAIADLIWYSASE